MNMDGSPSGFPGQLVAVLEALARAAVDEMNRCVEDGTAVLRLELSRSRSDIDGLKRKCDALEEQLRSSRRSSRRSRAQRRSRTPAAGAERLTPPENNNTAWETQSVDGDPDEEVLIKEESTDFSDAGESSYFDAAQTADSAERHHDVYGAAVAAGDQRPDGEGAELAVKHEEDEDAEDAEDAAPLHGCHGDAWSSNGNAVADSYSSNGNAVADSYSSNGNAVIDSWSSNGNAVVDSRSSNGNAVVDSRSSNGNAVVDSRSSNGNAVVDSRSNGNAVVDSRSSNGNAVANSRSSNGNAVVNQRSESPRQKTKRRARTFGYRRPQPDDDRGTAPPANRADSPPQNAASSFYGGGGFAVSRMRAWTAFGGGGDKRFGCTFCDKNFVRFSQLKEHLRSHTGEKPFACAQCGRSFTKQCNLIRHAVVHSGEKPYACSQCGKRFTQRSSLKSHQKTVH